MSEKFSDFQSACKTDSSCIISSIVSLSELSTRSTRLRNLTHQADNSILDLPEDGGKADSDSSELKNELTTFSMYLLRAFCHSLFPAEVAMWDCIYEYISLAVTSVVDDLEHGLGLLVKRAAS